jgi:hypothetical protein
MLLFCSTALKSGPMLTHLSICYIDSNINVKQVLNSEKKKLHHLRELRSIVWKMCNRRSFRKMQSFERVKLFEKGVSTY